MRNYYWLRYLSPDSTGGGGTEPTKEQKEFLARVTSSVEELLKTRGYQSADQVRALVTKDFEGINLEALRAFDQAAIDEKIRNIAAAVDKGKVTTTSDPVANMRAIINDHLDEACAIYESRGKGAIKDMSFKMQVRAAAPITTVNGITNEASLPDNIIESFSMKDFVEKRYGRQYIYDVANRTQVSEMDQYATWLEEGSEQGAFAIVAEGALKPLASYDLVRNFAEAKKVAGKYVVTEEFVKFRKNAYNIIQRLIRKKMVRDYNALLTADFLAVAAGYTGSVLDGTFTAPNDYDAIAAVAAQEETLNFVPDVLVLNPGDKWRIRTAKNVNGTYLFPITTEGGITRIFEFTVVTSTYQTPGTFTLAESGLFEIEEEDITVRMGYGIDTTSSGGNVTSVTSDFDNNRFRVIVEMFFKNWLPTAFNGSIVKASFATVKTALTTP